MPNLYRIVRTIPYAVSFYGSPRLMARRVLRILRQEGVAGVLRRVFILLKDIASGYAKQDFQDRSDIVNTNLLDAHFWGRDLHSSLPPDALASLYIHACRLKIGERKPMPGFHPGVYRDLHGVCDEQANPFADYIRAGLPEGPWALPLIRNTDACQELAGNPRIALHLHVFYEELLEEIIGRLLANTIRPDLFVSIPDGKPVEECRKILMSYPGQVVALESVPNRGRDIGPFLTGFGSRIAENYDFVGHLHTKKSAHSERQLGDNWRTFLLENLLGSPANRMMDRILGFMSNTPTVGMVFPDDPNIVGWTKNKPFADALAERLGISELPENFSFPIGTMFWARVDALQRFWSLGLKWEDYPEEPLPLDGTILHALERLFPLGLAPGLNQCAVTHVVGMSR